MIVVFAVDALESTLVEEHGYAGLLQMFHGTTDISEFTEPRTMVLWSSFMTGENKEAEVLAAGDREMWNTRWTIEETMFCEFDDPKVIDLPGFNYDWEVHGRSRDLLKQFFNSKDKDEKTGLREQYNKEAFEQHRKVKDEFTKSLEGEHDFLLGYFSIADVIGHLNFGNKTVMKLIYSDLDELASKAGEKTDRLLVLSDHGMKALGVFGDHSDHGFWSTSWDAKIADPRITDFKDAILSLKT